MLDQRDFTGKAALHHAVTDMEERHQVVQTLLAAKAQVRTHDIPSAVVYGTPNSLVLDLSLIHI